MASIDLKNYVTNDPDSEILKSVNDKKIYRHFVLDNGLRVILVQDVSDDPEASAASLVDGVDNGECDHECQHANHTPNKRARTCSHNLNDNGVIDADENDHQPMSEDVHSEDGEEEEEEGCCESTATRQSAMCLCVRVGSFDDPVDLQGLCHYTEHVVLMGNEEYPTVNEFDAFLERHCGYSNGHTEYEYTLYEAEIPNPYLEGCLQRFAACFKRPLFRLEDVTKEINPVHNEFVDSFTDDEVRMEHLMCSLAKPDHPICKFSWGNIESLVNEPQQKQINVRDRMMNFFEQHYKSEAMTLAIQSQESLEYMEELVRKHFSALNSLQPDKHQILRNKINQVPAALNVIKPADIPYDSSIFNRLHYVEPIEEGHHLKMYWIFAPLITEYECKPLHYIGSILGNEGPGSLLSYLRDQMLALDMMAGCDEHNFETNNFHTVFAISIQLTDEGLRRMEDVIVIVQHYLDMLNKMKPQKWFFEEEQLNVWNQFRFRNEQNPNRNVTDLARNSFLFPTKDLIVGSLFMQKFDEQLIESCTSHLRPDKAISFVLSKQAFEQLDKPVQSEKWANIRYKITDFPQTLKPSAQLNMAELSEELYFPKPNEFLTTDFALYPPPKMTTPADVEQQRAPSLLYQDSVSKLFYLQDHKFETPKAHISFQFVSTRSRDRLITAVSLDLYSTIFNRWIKKYSYPASMVNLDFELQITSTGFLMKFNGFNQNLRKLVALVFHHFVSMSISDQLFENMRSELLRSYANDANDCTELVEMLNKSLLIEGIYSPMVRRHCLFELKRHELHEEVQQFIQTSFIQCFVFGNVLADQARDCFDHVRSLVKSDLEQIRFEDARKIGVRTIPIGYSQLFYKAFNAADENVMVNMYFQLGRIKLEEQVLLSLMVQEMYEPLFNQLRNQENLAYMLYPYSECLSNIGSWGIKLRSLADKYTAQYIIDRIDGFLDNFWQHIQSLSADKFEELRQAKIKQLRTPFLNLRSQADNHFYQIALFEYRFNVHEEKANLLESKIEQAHFTSFVQRALSSIDQRKLVVTSIGRGEMAEQQSKPLNEFALQVYDRTGNQFLTINPSEKPIHFYDQAGPEVVDPDTIDYSLFYLEPVPKKEGIDYVTDVSAFVTKMNFHEGTSRSQKQG